MLTRSFGVDFGEKLMQKTALNVAAIVFLLIALVQITRYLLEVEVIASGSEVPLGLSFGASIVFVVLSFWMWLAGRRARRT